jgi:L-rhamnonate dehydratase
MKITAVRVLQLEGAPRSGLALFETPRLGLAPGEVTPYRAAFTLIETDAGVTGLGLGGSAQVKALGQSLIGADPLAIEAIWDRLYTDTYLRYERLSAVSSLDVALWDLAGKARGEPVYHLLGGPCQERVRAYAGMLGFSTEPEAAARSSAEWVAKGFTAVKWYLSYSARDGDEGFRRNVALVRAVREAVGDEVDIMVDCILADSSANSYLYALKLARALEPYRPAWLEEPLNVDDLDAYGRLAAATTIPLAFGEHWYTRWQIRQAIESGAPGVLQPEPMAAGGLTEMRKITALASVYGLPVIPHANESCRVAAHLVFATPARTCPYAEWGVRLNHNAQYFYRDFYEPREGYFGLPAGPGLGLELDSARIVRSVEL